MQEYELTVLIHPDRETDLEKSLDTVRELVKTSGGKVAKEDNWGKKRLAYEVKKNLEGFYCLIHFTAEPAVVAELDRVLKITEDVIKHMIVKQEA